MRTALRWLKVEVGVQQGSALSPCFFAVLIDGMADEARQATL